MLTKIISKTLLITFMLTLCIAPSIPGSEKSAAPPSKTTSTPKTTSPLKLTIGVVLPLSGPISPTGNGWARVYKLYFDKLNEKGGIKVDNQSYIVNLVVEDGKTNFEAARTATTKLVHVSGAKFVFGEIMESATQGIYDVTSAGGALHIISWINIPNHEADVNIKKPLCIRFSISPEDSIPVLLDDLVKTFPNVRTMVNCSPKIGYDPIDNLLVKMAKDRGINVIAREQWEWGTTDFLPVYTRVLAHKPDAIFAMVSAQAHSQLLAARQLGYKGTFLSSSPKGPEEFIRVAGIDACNDVITAGWDGNNPPTRILKEISQLWTKAYGNEPLLSGTV